MARDADTSAATAPARPDAGRLGPWPWGILIALFLASRLFRLTAFPLFIDEAWYLLFAEKVLQGHPAGLGDGKPLESLAVATGLVLGIEPVAAARLPHVAAGLVTLIAIGAFGQRFFSRRAAAAGMLLWIFLPFPLFFERLATPDAMLAAGGMTSLYASACLATAPRASPTLAWLAGGALAVTALTKMPVSFFFFLALPIAWWLLPRSSARPRRDLAIAMIPPALLALAVGATVTARFFLGLRPLGFGFFHLTQKGSLHTGWAGLLGALGENLVALGRFFDQYLGTLLAAWLGIAVLLALVRGRAVHRYLALIGGGYLLTFLIASKMLFSRYFLPALPPLALLMGWAAAELVVRAAGVLRGGRRARMALDGAAVGLLLALTLPFFRTLVTAPRDLPLPPSDRAQYIESWPSGFGFPAVARHLDQTLAEEPGAIAIALHKADEVRLRVYDPGAGGLAARLEQAQVAGHRTLEPEEQRRLLERHIASASRAYIVVNRQQAWSEVFAPHFPSAVEVAAFPRPGGGRIRVLALGIEKEDSQSITSRRSK